ncbi:MAG: hypothetical protein CYPHOPRED_000472 [Cyphobasidiales sp. Tagirdzhanova-0007]|nr:MAG: hypothetical protein CYPHOPRED_000472 [Cyphobasidiales sp. Tagirdzhanova-0007]
MSKQLFFNLRINQLGESGRNDCKIPLQPAAYGSDAAAYTYTCVADSALIPLFALLYIFASAAFLYRGRMTSRSEVRKMGKSLPAWLAWLYAILAVAAIAMQVLELARLEVSHSGMGLLIINAVALLLACLSIIEAYILCRESSALPQVVRLAFWLQLLVWEASKVGAYGKIKKHEDGPSSYKVSDRIVDETVMLALFAVFIGFELLAILRRSKNPSASLGEEKLAVERRPI